MTDTIAPRVAASGQSVERNRQTSATPSARAADTFSVSRAFHVGAQSRTRRVAADVAHADERDGTEERCHGREEHEEHGEIGREPGQRHEPDRELRRVDVGAAQIESGVVGIRVRRVPVPHGLRSRQIAGPEVEADPVGVGREHGDRRRDEDRDGSRDEQRRERDVEATARLRLE